MSTFHWIARACNSSYWGTKKVTMAKAKFCYAVWKLILDINDLKIETVCLPCLSSFRELSQCWEFLLLVCLITFLLEVSIVVFYLRVLNFGDPLLLEFCWSYTGSKLFWVIIKELWQKLSRSFLCELHIILIWLCQNHTRILVFGRFFQTLFVTSEKFKRPLISTYEQSLTFVV